MRKAAWLPILVLWAGIVEGASAQTLPGPSFDCGVAQSRREVLGGLICLDPGLARLDLLFVQSFLALRQQLPEPAQRDLRAEAVDFQAKTILACGIPRTGAATQEVLRLTRGCLYQRYEAQRSAWFGRLNPSARAEASRAPEALAAAQGNLRELGYLPPEATLDGIYGPTTRAAITAWQRDRGVSETGFIESWELAALQRGGAEGRERLASAERQRQQLAEQERQLRQEQDRRAEAERARRHEAERQLAADAERQLRAEAAASRLADRLGDLREGASVLVALGRDGGRLRRSLRGDLSLFDTGRPANACAIAGLGTDGDFLGYVEDQHRQLVGPPGRSAFRATCPGAEGIDGFDLVLVHRPSGMPAAAGAIEAIEARLTDGRLQLLEQVTRSAWQDDRRRRQVAAEEESRRRDAFVVALREDALSGRLNAWGAVALRGSRSDTACVVAEADPRWSALLAEHVPQDARGLVRRVQGDADADRQFARLLSGECGLLVARGNDLGDVLRGLDANRREGVVLPLRMEAATVRQALAVAPLAPPPSMTAPVALPAPPARSAAEAVPIALERPRGARARLPACDAHETFDVLRSVYTQQVAARVVNLRLLDLQEVREMPDREADRRSCGAVAVLNNGRAAILYTISPSRMEAGSFLVEVSE